MFGVDIRNVKAARRELVNTGLLVMEPTDQCSMNRWGPRTRFNLEWAPPARNASASSPPRIDENRLRSPPPKKNWELASRWINQKRDGGRVLVSAEASRWRVAPEDLREPERLERLFERAQVAGFCRSGEAAKLAFFSAAARARRVATENPAGLFATLVRRRLWNFSTLADEDLARRCLQRLEPGFALPSGASRASTLSSSENVAAILHRMLSTANWASQTQRGDVKKDRTRPLCEGKGHFPWGLRPTRQRPLEPHATGRRVG
jgi:hypothetical protein